MDLGKVGNKIANIGTLGLYDPARKILSGNANEYRAGEGDYNSAIAAAQGNNLTLQDALIAQMNGGGPNLGQQQFQNATQQLQQQAAGQIGGIKGISPAAQARLLQDQQARVGQNLAGESAVQRVQQQLLAQQQLGQNSLGLFDSAAGKKLGAQQVNAGVTNANTQAQSQLLGGALNGAGAAMGMGGGGKAAGGYIEPADGPQSELGKALMGMAEGGPVFMADGGVPGQAPVAGDSSANDVVPAALSPGEIVIPRSSAGSPEAAASFVEALQRRQGGGYGAVAKARGMCAGGKAYAEGGEVEEPTLAQRAAKWWESSTDAAREALVGSVADALPDAIGGRVRKQAGDRKAKIDAAAKGD